jgi:hypothetical protein
MAARLLADPAPELAKAADAGAPRAQITERRTILFMTIEHNRPWATKFRWGRRLDDYKIVYSGPSPPSGGVKRPPFAVIAPHCTQLV